ncbi:nuclear transport factor 2 family protein [Micromonospora cathayae]|uniref:Nuclear transport factor 2 family protein n=1 Tax=Micromonospora cathayae TaxID=3028804 RepID=A0ABY7ZQJ3_9ACTN|nr:nuclear transport factor 2 family protein [Micromonospora sp. HUAS 3]WDZ85296.1 nuclear transport factor 2 family protein [Micromonospora sp. HUAS 3]
MLDDALDAHLRHHQAHRMESAMTQKSPSDIVAEYFAGFRSGDRTRIHATLTDDVEWVIHGQRTASGRAEFHGEIDNPAFTGKAELDVQRVHEDGAVVVATGEGSGLSVTHGPIRFAFNNLFTFRDGLIARVDTYVVPLVEDRRHDLLTPSS